MLLCSCESWLKQKVGFILPGVKIDWFWRPFSQSAWRWTSEVQNTGDATTSDGGEQRLHTDLIPAEECVALPSVEDPRSVSVYVDALTSRFLTPDEDDCCVLPRSLEIKSCSIILKSAVSSCRRRHHPGGAVFSGAAGWRGSRCAESRSGAAGVSVLLRVGPPAAERLAPQTSAAGAQAGHRWRPPHRKPPKVWCPPVCFTWDQRIQIILQILAVSQFPPQPLFRGNSDTTLTI